MADSRTPVPSALPAPSPPRIESLPGWLLAAWAVTGILLVVLAAASIRREERAERARWDSRRRMQLALSMLADPALDILVSGECAFADLPSVMAQLTASAGDTLCHRIKY